MSEKPKRHGSENLRPPFSKESPEEARVNGAKGGVKSGEVRRAKKSMREAAEMVLFLKPPISAAAIKQLRKMGVEDDITSQTVALVKVMEKAMRGDINALQFIRDTAGQKPTDKVDVVQSSNVKTKVRINIKGLDVNDDEHDEQEQD